MAKIPTSSRLTVYVEPGGRHVAVVVGHSPLKKLVGYGNTRREAILNWNKKYTDRK